MADFVFWERPFFWSTLYFQLIIFSALEEKHFKESFYAPSKKYTVDFPKPEDGGRLAYIGLETKSGSFFDVYLGEIDILKILSH